MMKKTIVLNITFLVIFVLFSTCINDYYVEVVFDQETFAEQRQLWQQSNIKNYQYKFSNNMFFYSYCGLLFIENGEFKYDLPETEYSDISKYKNFSTIDEIYKTIEETYNWAKNTKRTKNDVYITEIIIEYDKINHIPNIVYFKEYVPPGLFIEGTLYYEITNFIGMD